VTQVKVRSVGGKGLTQAAWKYALIVERGRENFFRGREEKEKSAEAARKNITLPRLKWMERKDPLE
jgi:hypothetical protein